MKISAGMTISHFDNSPNGHTNIHQAKVIKAKGLGILVERSITDNSTPVKYRIPRSDVVRVIKAGKS
jgi:hypothetical protein